MRISSNLPLLSKHRGNPPNISVIYQRIGPPSTTGDILCCVLLLDSPLPLMIIDLYKLSPSSLLSCLGCWKNNWTIKIAYKQKDKTFKSKITSRTKNETVNRNQNRITSGGQRERQHLNRNQSGKIDTDSKKITYAGSETPPETG